MTKAEQEISRSVPTEELVEIRPSSDAKREHCAAADTAADPGYFAVHHLKFWRHVGMPG